MTNRNCKLIFKTESFRVFFNASVNDPYSVEWFIGDNKVTLLWDSGVYTLCYPAQTLNDACLIGYIGAQQIDMTNTIDAEHLSNCIFFAKRMINDQ